MNIFSFHGRAGRLEWWFILLVECTVIGMILFLYDNYIVKDFDEKNRSLFLTYLLFFLHFASLAISFGGLIVGWACSARRYHDRGKSGWWQLIQFIPLIGPIWMIIELGMLSGDSGSNRFGSATDDIFDRLSRPKTDNGVDKSWAKQGGYADDRNQHTSEKPVFGKRTHRTTPNK